MSIINEPKKRIGRPAVESEQLRARAEMSLVRAIEKWAEDHGVNRPEAIRRLIQIGLENSQKS